MSHSVLRTLAGMALLAASTGGMAATINITASFSPSVLKPQNNTFTNTTPQASLCLEAPDWCGPGEFTLDMGGITARLSKPGLVANATPRESLYFKMPGAWRDIIVVNRQTGDSKKVRFRINSFGATYVTENNWDATGQYSTTWYGGSFNNAPSPCSRGISTTYAYEVDFLWDWPVSNAACYKIPRVNTNGEPYLIKNMIISYQMTAPEPLKMDSGNYFGTYKLKIGPGLDIDFGDNYKPSDSQLDITFNLTVNHELKLTTTADSKTVSLQPCASGKVCTKDEGQANWERWMVTRIPPQLTGRSNFNLSSSGSFKVYLQCEQQSGPHCALRSDKMPSQIIPVQTLLTLPDNIVDYATGLTVSKRMLEAGAVQNKNLFSTKTFGQSRAGSIDFLVSQKDVETMLRTRPDTYRGAVTVVFEPKIY